MQITDNVLAEVRDLCLDFYTEEKSNIISIILYAGAARNFVEEDHQPGDFDVNIFFTAHSNVSSTYCRPKIIGKISGLDVEVMRNKVPEEIGVIQYVNAQDSKRWRRITREPVIQIYPDIERIDGDFG